MLNLGGFFFARLIECVAFWGRHAHMHVDHLGGWNSAALQARLPCAGPRRAPRYESDRPRGCGRTASVWETTPLGVFFKKYQ